VLAENEKLNAVIDEISQYSGGMGEFPNSNQAELEGRIAILIRDLEDWKARYSKLEKANPQVAEL